GVELGPVDLLLEPMIGLIADRAFDAQALERLALVLDRAQPQLVVLGRGLRIVRLLRHRASGRILIAHSCCYGRGVAGEAIKRSLHDDDACTRHLFLDRVVRLEMQKPKQRLQSHALQHQRAQHHAKRREHDQIATRKSGRQRERRGERHQTAHAAPCDEQISARALLATCPCPPNQPLTSRTVAPAASTQARRTRMTVARTTTPRTSASTRAASESRPRIGLDCNPMRTKASTLSTNTAVSQTE